MKNIYAILDELGVSYKKYDHPPVFTVEEAEKYSTDIPGGRSKNLFLRNKKGNKYFLVIAKPSADTNFEKLASLVGESSVGFASHERLEQALGVKSGAVSPFALINDSTKQVHVLVDQSLLGFDELGFHPNVNTSTLVISLADLKKFLTSTGNPVRFVEFS
jgi:Ala-tRNA(Pro) deacylase